VLDDFFFDEVVNPFCPVVPAVGLSNSRPVAHSARHRTMALRQSSVLDTLIGRECQDNKTVPTINATRFVVMMRHGGSVRRIHTGVVATSRQNMVVRAGRVVALVAVRDVDRKSVISRRGSRSMLHLVVNILSVSTISSNVF